MNFYFIFSRSPYLIHISIYDKQKGGIVCVYCSLLVDDLTRLHIISVINEKPHKRTLFSLCWTVRPTHPGSYPLLRPTTQHNWVRMRRPYSRKRRIKIKSPQTQERTLLFSIITGNVQSSLRVVRPCWTYNDRLVYKGIIIKISKFPKECPAHQAIVKIRSVNAATSRELTEKEKSYNICYAERRVCNYNN